MSHEGQVHRRRRRRLGLAAAPAAAVLVVALASSPFGAGSVPSATGATGAGHPQPYTDDSVPAANVTMFGATPTEHGGGKNETWGLGTSTGGAQIVRYTAESGWTLGPALLNQEGKALSGFVLDTPEAFSATSGPSPVAAQMTPDGAGAMVGLSEEKPVLLVREPGDPSNAFQETKSPEALLEHGERLFSFTRAPLLAPLDESEGHTGVLIVPVKERGTGIEEQVLHYSAAAKEWTKEKIELPAGASPSEFHVLGIGASSPSNAWLVAQVSEGRLALLRRQTPEGEAAVWKAVALKQGGEPGETLEAPNEKGEAGEAITVAGIAKESISSQILTVTKQGVWIDGERPEVKAPTTLFLKTGSGGEGEGLTSWCAISQSPEGTTACEHELPEALPSGPYRSFAWPSSSPFGERVITGLPDGTSLRLEGDEFRRLLGLGGADVGSVYGAAFTSPNEGWLGNQTLPVHLTEEPQPNRLAPWPVSFKHALVAAAPAPSLPVGGLSSEAIAVGDLGEVARYQPGKGWLPESLLGPGGRHETPRLRAVAWPTANRIFAVGDLGQMWLWRSETGLWETDPATPYNFRGNLDGIAFEQGNLARGYAVGQQGVLLSYGKTWSQEPFCGEAGAPAAPNCVPAELAKASFTSIAFAGSEAIIAYRILKDPSINRYNGGLLVNDGDGWHIDTEAASAMGTNVPWAVAGLPDGGAAFGASGMVYERESAGQPWHAAATPFPGGGEPGSLAIFREAGQVRVIAAGSAPDTYDVERAPEAPPGFPPTLIGPYPLPSNAERGVLRQTATGWSDEQHELNSAKAPQGNWKNYDTVYQPDPVAQVLVNESGNQGWAIGGAVEPTDHGGVLDTADIERYPAEAGASPPGVETAPILTEPKGAVFAIGGNAQCASPCSARANAKIGPDVWLRHALASAGASGARGFFYTGPRVVDPNAVNGPKEAADEFSYGAEFERYAQLLGESKIPAYAVGDPYDVEPPSGTLGFTDAFRSFPRPFGAGPSAGGFGGASEGGAACGASCPLAYAMDSAGTPTVRIIVMDNTHAEVSAEQTNWVSAQLAGARAAKEPAIVIGNKDLRPPLNAHETWAEQLVAAMGSGEASAYFFDAPERNIRETLTAHGTSVEADGSGTLGYVNYTAEAKGEFLGASGYLLAQVPAPPAAGPYRVHVTVELIPNIEELAMEAKDGALVRRSSAALFSGLARRPRSGNRSPAGGQFEPDTDLYVPIPSECIGAACTTEGILPSYTFSSSKPDIGEFVEQELSISTRSVRLNPKTEQPIADSHSGLFCAFNAGETTVKITSGGLSASLPVVVQKGSVRRPCGTTLLTEKPAKKLVPTPTPVEPTPETSPSPQLKLVLPALPAAVTPVAPRPAAPAPLPPFAALPAGVNSPILAVLPPPLPTPARPTPPSGTSPVSQPVAEQEEESEEATESVGNQASAYAPAEHDPLPEYLIGIIVLAAFAGAATRRPRRGRRAARIAPATITSIRWQRRNDPRRRNRW